MDEFANKLAVVTGGGSGMGRELVRQLASEGCSVAACDWNVDSVAAAAAAATAGAPAGVLVTGHACDVSNEAQVQGFRDEVVDQHAADHVDLVFSNAGVGGGPSFVVGRREEWERTFTVNWRGTYNCARTFLPLLIASGDGVLVNTSSVNGFWASLGPGMPNTAYATAKFAIRGFTEALIEDLRTNAPQVRVAVVMPGHVGTDIIANSRRANGMPEPLDMSDEQIEDGDPCRRAGWPDQRRHVAQECLRRRPAPTARADGERLSRQGAADRGRRGHGHPRRGSVRPVANPRGRRRQDARRGGARHP